MSEPPLPRRRRSRNHAPVPRPFQRPLAPESRRALALLIWLCLLVELVLQGADLRLWGQPWWRSLTFGYGAFWPGLLGPSDAGFPGQGLTMFLTHPFLHAGLGHLAGNMVTLVIFGTVLLRQMRPGWFLLLYALSATGGALAYATLSSHGAPMVGASGAISGLVGAYVIGQVMPLTAYGLRQLAGFVVIYGLANLVMFTAQNGTLAWQAHLGGLLTGFAFALIRGGPRRRR